jgi:hypothetical protein
MDAPAPRLSPAARIGAVFLILSLCVSWRQTSWVDGEVVSDLDYGAGTVALVALALLLYAVGRAGELDDALRGQRLLLLYGLSALAGLRLWAAAGFWPL